MSYLFYFAWSVFFIVVGLFCFGDVILNWRGMEKQFIFSKIIICALSMGLAAYLIAKMFVM